MQHGTACIGLIVDELHSVAQFAHGNVTPNPLSATEAGSFVTSIIRANGGELAIQLLDPPRLCSAFGINGLSRGQTSPALNRPEIACHP